MLCQTQFSVLLAACPPTGYQTPLSCSDAMVSEYKALWEALNVEYDSFIRTTDPHHEALVQEVLERVW